MNGREQLRKRLMHRWWDFRPLKPLRLQNGVGWIGCLLAGHEREIRGTFCGWCGKEMKKDA